MSLIKIEVDPDKVFDRTFSDIERTQLPFAAVQAANSTAFATRDRWSEVMPKVFDRPTALTMKAVVYSKATKNRPVAEVLIRDEAFKGTPPAKYLLPQVEGGSRRPKRAERALQRVGVLPQDQFVVPGKGAKLDAHGNVPGAQITAILSAMRAQQDPYQHVTAESMKRRRAKRKRRGGEYFAVKKPHGKLQPGIYERIDTGFGSGVRSVLFFVKAVSYRARYDIFGMARKIYDSLYGFHFDRELRKAVETSKFRGKG